MMSRVGSLITQGVYSVATPFHPFGGAVDIIVVQQQDGSFRSTPWYVQFGKFQGVLKGAEKMVRITVNGVEADFHMYLNNSGEAYFVREGDLGGDDDGEADKKGGLKDEGKGVNGQCNVDMDDVENFRRLERNESDASLFYDFQDDQSFDSPVELLSEYGSGRFDNIDMEKLAEAQGTDSEMVLVSVDGHILTAPILSSEQITEYVQLDTPQFHLGPGEGNMFSGGDNSFTVVENAWDSEYHNDLDAPSSQPLSIDTCKLEDNVIPDQVKEICEDKGTDVLHEAEACEKGEEFGRTEDLGEVIVDLQQLKSEDCKEEPMVEDKGQESCSIEIVPKDIYVSSDVEGTSPVLKGGEDRFKSCLDFTKHASGETVENEDSPSKAQEVKDLEERPSLNVHESNINETKCASEKPQLDDDSFSFAPDFSSQVVERVHTDIDVDVESPGSASISKDEDLTQNSSAKAAKSSLEEDVAVTETCGGDVEDTSPVFKAGEDRFKSCLDFTKHASGEPFESEDSPSKAQEVKDLEERPSLHESNINETKSALEKPQLDDASCSFAPDFASQVVERVHTDIDVDIESPGSASTSKDEDLTQNSSAKAAKSCLEEDVAVTETYGGDVLEGQTMNSSEKRTENLRPIEISLCGHLLRPGMGSNAAAESFKAHLVSEEEFRSSATSVIKNGNLVIRYKEKYLPWEKAAPIVLGLASFGLNIPLDSKDAIPVEEVATPKLGKSNSESASGRRWRLWSIPFRRVATLQHSNSASSDEVFVDSESFAQSPSSIPQSPTSLSDASRMETCKSPLKKIFRTNITTNEQIASLNLKEGQNDVTFSFSTRVLGLQQVEAHIYLWKWNARIVISDVDGTITKSDVLGQFMPLVGKDWSQSGVARLFSAIKENGYQLLFLSARAIVQAYLTKSFLFNLKQDGKTLPTGPVVISPDGLFPSLFREVIRRAPHEFKIACLEDIKALFPSDYNPFYAGFGNRDTDEYTYKKLGIPKGKIFIINPKGEVAINHRVDVKSYTSLHTLVHDMFPPTSMVEQEDYNPWNYWKIPIPDIDD